jgi:hypothetical protein
MSTAFRKYIKDTHEGLGDAQMAFRLGNRKDKWMPKLPRHESNLRGAEVGSQG